MKDAQEGFRAILAREGSAGVEPHLDVQTLADLPHGDVLIEVTHSSLNYKDVLSAFGNRGVTRSYPHVPGIDAAGTVLEAEGTGFARGESVFVTGHDLGMNTSGGLSERIRVPAEWVLRIPDDCSPWEIMAAGTAGFTAAQSVYRIVAHEKPGKDSRVLVTGATGAVGSYAVALLAHVGFSVIAASRRAGDDHVVSFLRSAGAESIMDAQELQQPERPLSKARWRACVDCVGGPPLAAALSMLEHRGCATTCGMVAGSTITSSIFPFILRGITLYGIDSAECPADHRAEIWNLLTGEWRLPRSMLEHLCSTTTLEEVPNQLERMRSGGPLGHTVVTM